MQERDRCRKLSLLALRVPGVCRLPPESGRPVGSHVNQRVIITCPVNRQHCSYTPTCQLQQCKHRNFFLAFENFFYLHFLSHCMQYIVLSIHHCFCVQNGIHFDHQIHSVVTEVKWGLDLPASGSQLLLP